ncbi:iron-sulfur cluster repair di-iron protein [Bacillus carboniphilus]|uniref:Iron-sulfur cluster repair di-iron protein n=1 Tax=Bacillus carboniphilus TaxID=86663 RepID=A0ABP3FVD1_9BACI
MEYIFDQSMKTGDIVTQFPRASQVLKEYRIDFCCGGNRPIGEAIQDKELNPEEVLNKINHLYQETIKYGEKDTNWEVENYTTLIDYVLDRHHAYLNKVLPELSGYVTKVYRVHGGNHPELGLVYKLYQQLKVELEHHLIEEEDKIFPKVKLYEQEKSLELLKQIVATIDALESEHETAGSLLKEIREVTNDYQLPEGACNTYRLTFLKLAELESDLFDHIHLENNVLFPRLNRELPI